VGEDGPISHRQFDRDVLKGLPGAHVIVVSGGMEAKSAGLTEETIRTIVESRLGAAGMKVLSEAEWSDAPGRPFLHIVVGAAETQGRLQGSVQVALLEKACLERDVTSCVFASTWMRAETFEDRSADDVFDKLRELVDAFISDYLAANPKTAAARENVAGGDGDSAASPLMMGE
jgi:hypothetical protein